jgi:hypothetical protein
MKQYVEDDCKIVIGKDRYNGNDKRIPIENVDIISVVDDDLCSSGVSPIPKSNKEMLKTVKRNMSNSFDTILDTKVSIDKATPEHDSGVTNQRVLRSDPKATETLFLSLSPVKKDSAQLMFSAKKGTLLNDRSPILLSSSKRILRSDGCKHGSENQPYELLPKNKRPRVDRQKSIMDFMTRNNTPNRSKRKKGVVKSKTIIGLLNLDVVDVDSITQSNFNILHREYTNVVSTKTKKMGNGVFLWIPSAYNDRNRQQNGSVDYFWKDQLIDWKVLERKKSREALVEVIHRNNLSNLSQRRQFGSPRRFDAKAVDYLSVLFDIECYKKKMDTSLKNMNHAEVERCLDILRTINVTIEDVIDVVQEIWILGINFKRKSVRLMSVLAVQKRVVLEIPNLLLMAL